MKCAGTPTLTTLTLTASGTGYSFTMPAGAYAFSIQARTAVDVLMGLNKADVESGGSPYITIKSGTVFNSPEMFRSMATTLWFSAGSNSIVLEILTWA